MSSDGMSSISSSSNNIGMVDNMVGGVGGGVGVHTNLGNMLNLSVDLVANKTGLRNQMGLEGLVDTGSGDSNRSLDSMDLGDNSMGNSNWGSMGNSNRGSMGNSNRGSMSNGSDGSGSIAQTSSSDGTSIAETSSNGTSIAKTSSNGTSIAKTSSNGTSIAKTMSSNNTGVGISHRGGHGGTEESRKDNKGVHLAES